MHDAITVAQARSTGLSLRQLRSREWQRVGYGIYRPTGVSPDPERALRDALPALPHGSAFCHLTAAQLYGLWLPWLPPTLPRLVSVRPGADRIVRPGFYVFRSRAGEPPTRSVRGLPAVSPALCVGQLAEDLSVLDLTVAIDSLLHQQLCTVADIRRAIRSRQRGLPRLRRAIDLCDPRSESPWETILRLLHVSTGIAVTPQVLIEDAYGRIVARADLLIDGTRRLAEYDGAVHRDREQHHDDLRREKELHRLGYERFGYVASEILERPHDVIRDAEHALGRPHDPRRLVDWLELSSPSSLTSDGIRRLTHRLHRFD